MTKEKLVARRAQLEKERAQLLANLQAYEGAIQDIDYWLNEVAKEEEETSNA